MNNFVRFKDAVNLTPIEIPQKVKDYYAEAISQGLQDVKPLKVFIAATHAGKVTRNNGFYLPSKMMSGAHTFTAQYPKPIQIHHEDQQDPIGRVLDAQYIDTSQSIRDSLKDSITSEDDQSIQDFTTGKMSFEDMTDFANKWIINDLNITNDPDYEGLGYIKILANITDPDAIQKILDGRYLTGSVGATTNKAVCSICKQDWATSEGPCKHRPGKMYDDAKCIIIAGDLNYDEYSFVNKPADRHSRVIEVNINGVQDFVTLDEEDISVCLIVDNTKREPELTISIPPDFVEVKDTEEDLIRDFFKDEYDAIVGDDSWGKEYIQMIYESIIAGDQKIQDKKLSAEERKKLAKSTFCGPDRSFPVPDCSHARVAMAYAKKYNKPSSIIACIRRKAKRLGCPFKDGDSKKRKDMEFTPEEFDRLSDEEVASLYDTILATMKERKMKHTCEESVIEEAVQKAKKDINTELQETNEKLTDRLEAMRKEVRYLHGDIENLTNAVAEKSSEVHQAQVLHLADLYRLTGQDNDLETLSEELKEKSSEELDKMIKDLTAKVDTKKIADTLNSGLSNNPTGIIEDPTLVEDNSQESKPDKKINDAQRSQLRSDWLRLNMAQGKEIADNWLSDTCKALDIDLNSVMPAEKQS